MSVWYMSPRTVFSSPNIIGHYFIACIMGSKLFMQHSELARESISTTNIFILLLDEVIIQQEVIVRRGCSIGPSIVVKLAFMEY